MLKPAAYILLLTVILSGCGIDQSMKAVDPYIFVHDNSSKIWLVDQLLINKNDYTPMQFRYKELIAFHENRNAYFYRMNEFGDHPGVKATFWMDKSKREFGFDFDKKSWIFHIVSMTRTKIVLRPKNHSFNYTMVLIPFPEF